VLIGVVLEKHDFPSYFGIKFELIKDDYMENPPFIDGFAFKTSM
jgi:hypothetical protein